MTKKKERCPVCKSTKLTEFSRGGMGSMRWNTYIECELCLECGVLFIPEWQLKEWR